MQRLNNAIDYLKSLHNHRHTFMHRTVSSYSSMVYGMPYCVLNLYHIAYVAVILTVQTYNVHVIKHHIISIKCVCHYA